MSILHAAREWVARAGFAVLWLGVTGALPGSPRCATRPASGGAPEPPLLVVVTDTGTTREGLPVFAACPDETLFVRGLGSGFSGRLLRLYRLHQEERSRTTGSAVEPAYLALTRNQGGFPRRGFWLGSTAKPTAGYVDLRAGGALAGEFGAMDQIFPHELLHVLVMQLCGDPPPGGANQLHALTVRTDPVTAFAEGFAEHAQVMAVDAPDAAGATRALALDLPQRAWAEKCFADYARALGARVAFVPRATMTFPLWWSRAEQVMRYWAVKENRIARAVVLPERLLSPRHAYAAYRLANVVLGTTGEARKSPAVALSTEGAVSSLFCQWVQDARLQAAQPGEFYAPYGTTAAELDGLDQAYLKIFHVLAAHRPADTASFVRAYRARFPAEAAAVDSLVASVLGAPLPAPAPEIWLANPEFTTGTSLFDQWRGLPRPHTFDLNAAAAADWAGVPGLDPRAIEALVARAPYPDIAALARVPGVPATLPARVDSMANAFVKQQAATVEEQAMMRLRAILLPYLWRALWAWAGASLVAVLLLARLRASPWPHTVARAILASLVALLAGWTADSGTGLVALFAPVVCLGVPLALVGFLRCRRSLRRAGLALLAWLVAALPAALAVRPWG